MPPLTAGISADRSGILAVTMGIWVQIGYMGGYNGYTDRYSRYMSGYITYTSGISGI